MRRRTLGNGAILATVLLVSAGLGVAVASAATTTAGSASPTASATVSPSAAPSPSSSAGGDNACEDVFLVTKPAGDAVGQLCTAVTADGTSIDGVKVTFTASSSCTSSVVLRVSGTDADDVEYAKVKTVACSSDTAAASFDPVSKVDTGTFVCGTLLSDEYTAAQACVAIS